MIKLGFIGAGNMAGAIIGGVTGSGFLKPHELGVYDTDDKKLEYFSGRGQRLLVTSSR